MKVRNYVALGLGSFLMFVIALFPANLVWKGMASTVSPMVPGKVQSVGGTLWDGFVVIDLKFGAINTRYLAKWNTHPLNLLLGEVSIELSMESEGFILSGGGYVGVFGKGIQELTGHVSASLAESLLTEFGVRIDEGLSLENVTVTMSGDTISEATGSISWKGGSVGYSIAGSSQTVDFPGVLGTLSENEGTLRLALIETKGNQPLGEAMLRSDGIGGVKVLQRVMTIAGISSSPGDDDNVLVNIQRPVF
ncbi:MAG: hypothetical protein COA99_14965 [Moraxellaceae bacterium]|nr:MAG: hypothetical protein COA99_14965 [Moraxellaceae bacterium]